MSSAVGVSVLVVVPAWDDRSSTAVLSEIIAELRAQGGRVHLWALREGSIPGPEDHLVDGLRNWFPARLAELVGATGVAHHLRGMRLRLWWALARPDIVLLDDGVGARVIPSRRSVTLVARINAGPSPHSELEAPVADPDLTLLPPGAAEPAATAVLSGPLARRRAIDDGAADRRAEARRRLGLPQDDPLVVGWGDDAWIDGVDLFVRAVWTIHRRGATDVHGAWLGHLHPIDVERITYEARRCGIEDHVHLRAVDTVGSDRACGDVAFLPYRCADDEDDLQATAVGGEGVVTFPWCNSVDELIRVVPYLDVDRAADELAALLSADRDQRWADAARRHDLRSWTESFLRRATAART